MKTDLNSSRCCPCVALNLGRYTRTDYRGFRLVFTARESRKRGAPRSLGISYSFSHPDGYSSEARGRCEIALTAISRYQPK